MSVIFCGAGKTHKKKNRKPKLNKHDSAIITSLVAGHATCDTCRAPAQLCASGANAPCDEAFWNAQLATVFNCHELPYSNLNARLTYKFFCTSNVVEFAFFHGKRWGWVPGDNPGNVPYEDATDIDWHGTPERKLNCGKFPDDNRQRMYAFIALVSGMDNFFYEDNEDASDNWLGEWRMPEEWEDDYTGPNFPSRFLSDHNGYAARVGLAPGGQIICEYEGVYDPAEDYLDDDGQDNENEEEPYHLEMYLKAILPQPLGGEQNHGVAEEEKVGEEHSEHSDSDSEGANDERNDGVKWSHVTTIINQRILTMVDQRRRFYNKFLNASKLLFELPEVLQMLRNTQTIEWTPPVDV